jgi:hypothetical protein
MLPTVLTRRSTDGEDSRVRVEPIESVARVADDSFDLFIAAFTPAAGPPSLLIAYIDPETTPKFQLGPR